MNKKKILIIGPSPTKSKGGMATVIKEMLSSDILSENYQLDLHESYRDGNLIYRILFSIYSFFKFLCVYKKYDIFHIHMASYGSTFRKEFYMNFLYKKNKKIILHIHGAEYIKFYNKLSTTHKEKVKKIWKKATYIIVLSEQWKKDFENIFDNKNIVVINNGINIDNLKEGRSEVTKYQNNLLLLGRLGKRKGAYDLIKAIENIVSEFPNMRLYMAGDGEIEKVRNIVLEKQLDKNIIIVGWANFNKKIELLKKCSTVVLPSYNEGLPMTILEGMAIGKIIISTNVGGIPEVVKNGENGIILEPGDIEALSNAMKKVMSSRDFIESCSRNNIKKIKENFSMDTMHNKIKELYIK